MGGSHVTFLDFFVLAFAVHRVTHLVTEDTFPPVRWARDRVSRRRPEGAVAYLVTCFWCVSFWVALAFVVAAHWWQPARWGGDVEVPAALVLALSTAASMLETAIEYLDVKIVNGGGG